MWPFELKIKNAKLKNAREWLHYSDWLWSLVMYMRTSPIRLGIHGIVLSVICAGAVFARGHGEIDALSVLIAGIDVSLIGAIVLAFGPRYSFLEAFSIFLLLSVEVGLLVLMRRERIDFTVTFFGSMLLALYGTVATLVTVRRFTSPAPAPPANSDSKEI